MSIISLLKYYVKDLPLEKWIYGFEGSTEALLLDMYYFDKTLKKVLIDESALERNYEGFLAVPGKRNENSNFVLVISGESYRARIDFINDNSIVINIKEQKGLKIRFGDERDKPLVPLVIHNVIQLERIEK